LGREMIMKLRFGSRSKKFKNHCIRQSTATTRDQAERCKGSSAMERKCKVTSIKLN